MNGRAVPGRSGSDGARVHVKERETSEGVEVIERCGEGARVNVPVIVRIL